MMLRALSGPGSGRLIKKGNSVLRPPSQVLRGEVAPRPAATRARRAPSGAVRLSRASPRSCWACTRVCVGPTVRGASVFAPDLHAGGVKPGCSELLQVVPSLLFLLPPPPFVTVPDTLKRGGGCPALLAEPPGSPLLCKKEQSLFLLTWKHGVLPAAAATCINPLNPHDPTREVRLLPPFHRGAN